MDIESVARGLIFDTLKKRLVSLIVSKAAFLGFPPFSWLLGYFLDKILEALYTEGRLNVKYAVIDQQTLQDAVGAESARSALTAALKKGDSDAIEAAKKEFRERYAKLIHLRPPP